MGLLLANSLHFVRDKQAVLAQLVELLAPGGQLLLVEYNATRGNGAVPYPLDDAGVFCRWPGRWGLREVRIVKRVPSSFLGRCIWGWREKRGQ